MFGKSVPVVLAALMVATSVQAADAMKAQLQSATGQVAVMQAKGLASGHAGLGLAAGDRVVVKTGEASVRYADGCAVTLKAGAMATIGALSPCAGGAGVVSANPANPQAFTDMFKHVTPGGVVAAGGSILLGAAVLDGIANGDTRCNTYVDSTCATSP